MELPPQLQITIAQLNKQYTDNSILRLGDEEIKPIPVIPTGALSLDLALGVGGLPKGRIVEIYGPESSGKSTIALSVVAEAQKQGGIVAYIDAEHALDPQYAKALGCNVEDLLLAQPDHGEAALDIVEKLVKSRALSVIVVDSVAALTPKAELEGEMSDQQMGLQARLMAKSMRKIVGAASDAQTLIVFINQLRQKIGVMFGNPETTPGGMALKYASSVRIDLRKREDIKDKQGDMVGVRVKAKIVKNKVAPPLKITEFDIIYGRGVDTIGCIFDLAVERGLIQKSGSWFSYKGDQIGQGRGSGISFLASDLDLAEEIKELVVNDGEPA